MSNTVTLTNPGRQGDPAFRADVFHADPVGHIDSGPIETRVIAPGITALLTLKPGNYLVVQHAPEPPYAGLACCCED